MATWSYTIMGCSKAFFYDATFFDYIYPFLTEGKGRNEPFPEKQFVSIIKQKYDKLLDLVIKQKSRLAYQVFGVFLMRNGAKMTDDVRKLILKHSRWEDEEYQLIDSEDRLERLYYLSDFRERVIKYVEGVKTQVPHETSEEVVQKLRKRGDITTNYPFIIPPERTPIDYKIINSPEYLF